MSGKRSKFYAIFLPHHKELGGFVLIDRVESYDFSLWNDRAAFAAGGSCRLAEDGHHTSSSCRAEHMNQKPKTIWLTGLSGAGKSTIANCFDNVLLREGRFTMTLDGDKCEDGTESRSSVSRRRTGSKISVGSVKWQN